MKIYICLILFIGLAKCQSSEETTGKLAILQSDFEKAAEWLPIAMAAEPDNPEIPLVMAIEIYARKQSWKEMVRMFVLAMEIDPDAVVEIRGQPMIVKEAVENFSEYYWAQEYNKGVEQLSMMKEDYSIEYLENAIYHFFNSTEINPSFQNTIPILTQLYRQLGDTYYDYGRSEEAIIAYDNAIKFESDEYIKADIFFNIGTIHNRMNNYEAAVLSFEKAFSINKKDYDSILGIVYAYEGLGDSYLYGNIDSGYSAEDAISWYNKAKIKMEYMINLDLANKEKNDKYLELLIYKCTIFDQDGTIVKRNTGNRVEVEKAKALKKLEEGLQKYKNELILN